MAYSKVFFAYPTVLGHATSVACSLARRHVHSLDTVHFPSEISWMEPSCLLIGVLTSTRLHISAIDVANAGRFLL